MVRKGILTLLYILLAASVGAQELQVKVNINSSQVEGTDKSVFENLQQTLEQWMNDKQWTELQFQKDERINVNFNITVQKYDKANNRFECSAMIQANRPVYNSAYTTTLYNNKDGDFNFDFAQFDQLSADSLDGVLCLSDYRSGSRQLWSDGRYRGVAALHEPDE